VSIFYAVVSFHLGKNVVCCVFVFLRCYLLGRRLRIACLVIVTRESIWVWHRIGDHMLLDAMYRPDVRTHARGLIFVCLIVILYLRGRIDPSLHYLVWNIRSQSASSAYFHEGFLCGPPRLSGRWCAAHFRKHVGSLRTVVRLI